MYPVGSFYFSTQSISPSSLFGGTWTQITNAAIRGATTIGYTGSDSTTLTINQIPAHQHNASGTWLAQSVAGGGVATGFDTYWGTGNLTYNTTPSRGGGRHTQSCNAPSIAISGIVLRKPKRVVVM